MKSPKSPRSRLAAAIALATVPFALLLGGAAIGQLPPNHLLVGTVPDNRNPGNV